MIIAIRFVNGEKLAEIQIPCEDYKQMGDNAVRVGFKSDRKLKNSDIDTKIKVSGEIKEIVIM